MYVSRRLARFFGELECKLTGYFGLQMQIGCTSSTKVAGGLLASRTPSSMLISYPARGGIAEKGGLPAALRPSFVIREIRDTRLLSSVAAVWRTAARTTRTPSQPLRTIPNIFRNPAEDCVARTEIFRAINFTSICKNPRRGPAEFPLSRYRN